MQAAEGNKMWREEEAALNREQHKLFLLGALSSKTQQWAGNAPAAGEAGKWPEAAGRGRLCAAAAGMGKLGLTIRKTFW